MTDCVLEMMDFVLEMMDFVFSALTRQLPELSAVPQGCKYAIQSLPRADFWRFLAISGDFSERVRVVAGVAHGNLARQLGQQRAF